MNNDKNFNNTVDNSSEPSFEDLLNESFSKPEPTIKVGDKVNTKVVAMDGDNIYLDLGTRMEGVVKKLEYLENNELLVKVYATTVNRTDCANLTAKPFIMRFSLGLFSPKKQILGTEFSGVVESIGKSVVKFNVGDKVFGFDDSILSSYAEYMVIGNNTYNSIIGIGVCSVYNFTYSICCIVKT